MDLKYAMRDGPTWMIETVDSVGYAGTYSSIALDWMNNPRISYYDEGSKDLRYAYRDNGIRTILVVDDEGDIGMYTSLALDSTGKPHITYYDETNEDLKFAVGSSGGSWILNQALEGGSLILTWNTVIGCHEYWIFGADYDYYFQPELAFPYAFRLDVLPQDSTSWTSANGISDPDAQWSYQIIAVDDFDIELSRTNKVGEYDFDEDLP